MQGEEFDSIIFAGHFQVRYSMILSYHFEPTISFNQDMGIQSIELEQK